VLTPEFKGALLDALPAVIPEALRCAEGKIKSLAAADPVGQTGAPQSSETFRFHFLCFPH